MGIMGKFMDDQIDDIVEEKTKQFTAIMDSIKEVMRENTEAVKENTKAVKENTACLKKMK